ncbi:TetR/AcrR family transcriptional regulator [Actinomadura rupiterrae]|uniref:TetR/AcrR family transcriptional regulator n=1 Tax=Actinomadura rupiterrae TaxID=559627 RepID=UPI0020A2F77B|nr:TetR/AcrR family transcriptional regulator [Actinomadura rupiterrae]MCP2339973.1 AcrR family transcriptional regulator [Actinomadura rupiterrae]
MTSVSSDVSAEDRTRAAILRAAASALRAHERASMAQIARAAGLGRATVYRYFANRDDLLAALARHSTSESVRALDEAGLDACPPATGVERIVRALLRVGRDYYVPGRAHPGGSIEEQAIRERGAAVVARGQQDGVFRADRPADQLAAMLGFLVEGALVYEPFPAMGLEDAADAITAQFLDGARP